MIIYKITNLINKKIYIGLTTRILDERIKEHINDAFSKRFSSYLHNALRKYGIENFTAEIIDNAYSIEDLNNKEIYWINFYNCTNKRIGYNNKHGGSNGKHLPESIEKIKEAGRNRKCSDETREKLRKNKPPSHLGKKRSKDTKRKMSESQKGIKKPKDQIERMRQSMIGKKHSEETKKKMSEIHKKRLYEIREGKRETPRLPGINI